MKNLFQKITRALRRTPTLPKAPPPNAATQQLVACVQQSHWEAAAQCLLTQPVTPSPEAIAALEAFVLASPEGDMSETQTWVAYGLCHAYLGEGGAETLHSQRIMALAQAAAHAEGILFPIFKHPRFPADAETIKHQPFIYAGTPAQDVRLYYKTKKDAAFVAAPMAYWHFGLYFAKVPCFYMETLHYYMAEEHKSGNIATPLATVRNTTPHVENGDALAQDPFFALNNARIHTHMFDYDAAENALLRLQHCGLV